MDRIRKLFKRKPKPDPAAPKPNSIPNDMNRSHIPLRFQQQNQNQHQQFPVLTDGAADSANDTARITAAGPVPATRSGQLSLALVNRSNASNVYAYISGLAIDRNNSLCLLSADGRTPYYPPQVSATGSKMARDISIPLGAPGNVVNCVIPRLAGGRIWFSVGRELVFALNPGPGASPGLVEPSVFNQQDPNINTVFAFAEFTFNSSQVFANISYVDFISLPISLALRSTNTSNVQRVSGLPPNGLETIAEGLRAQTKKDGRRWSSLVVPKNDGSGRPLRILSPNSALLLNPTWFRDYFAPHVDRVWDTYKYKQLTVNTQSAFGDVDGQVGMNDNLFDFGPGGRFAKPSTGDIFSCSTGPFATGSNAERNTIIPRLAAALNRGTLFASQETPNGTGFPQYYQTPITNHYSRIVHEANTDKHGYAFPYDDVTPDGGVPQEGAVFSFSPEILTVAVGGR